MNGHRHLSSFATQCPRSFVVSEPMEERCEVVYARNAMEARRLGHGVNDLGSMDDETDLLVRRAPEFDDLRGTTVVQVQLDTGWVFWCGPCGKEGITADNAVVVDGLVYCSLDCAAGERKSTE